MNEIDRVLQTYCILCVDVFFRFIPVNKQYRGDVRPCHTNAYTIHITPTITMMEPLWLAGGGTYYMASAWLPHFAWCSFSIRCLQHLYVHFSSVICVWSIYEAVPLCKKREQNKKRRLRWASWNIEDFRVPFSNEKENWRIYCFPSTCCLASRRSVTDNSPNSCFKTRIKLGRWSRDGKAGMAINFGTARFSEAMYSSCYCRCVCKRVPGR